MGRMGEGASSDHESDVDMEMDAVSIQQAGDPMDVNEALEFPGEYVNKEFMVVKHRV